MIKHIVMYKLKDATVENAEALRDKFLSMRDKIDCLRTIESGVDVLHSPRSYDVVLICTFDSLEAMAQYREHPVHLPVMAYVKSVIESAKAVDFEY